MPADSHFIAFDTPAFRGRARALCGALVDSTQHANVPTCVPCRAQLAEDERAIQRLTGGATDAATS